MEQNQSFSIESMLKCCDFKRGGREVNVNVIMTLIFPQGLRTRPLILSNSLASVKIICAVAINDNAVQSRLSENYLT